MIEIWKKANGYSNYEVSNLGRIKTFNWKGSGRESILKPALDKSGYLRTVLKGDNGISKTIKVHRVILNTFKPQNNFLEVNHINGIKTDNRAENLRYITQSDNLKGRFISKSKRLSTNEVIEIKRKLSEKTTTHKELANKYGTTYKNISNINIGIRHAKVNG